LAVFIGFYPKYFLMLEQSKFIWDLPTPLEQVSTPWRFFVSGSVYQRFSRCPAAVKLIKPQALGLSGRRVIDLFGFIRQPQITYELMKSEYTIRIFFDNYTGVATGWKRTPADLGKAG